MHLRPHYRPSDHEVWSTLYARMATYWQRYANPHFLDGLIALRLPTHNIPSLAEVNRRLTPITGFRATPVSGCIPAPEFFAHLRRREFPTTITIRPRHLLDYLPEPDIFHDVAGHVPMHTNPAFAATLVRVGEAAQAATGDPTALQALARFFWFTIEFGLMRTPRGLRAYGSGLLSSHGELAHALESPSVERRPATLDALLAQPFEIDHFQPVLFTVDNFEHLYELTAKLEEKIASWPRTTSPFSRSS